MALTCCRWVNKYCCIHSLVSCPVNLSGSLFLRNGVTAKEEEERPVSTVAFVIWIQRLGCYRFFSLSISTSVSCLSCWQSISAVHCLAFLSNPEITVLHLVLHSSSHLSILLLNKICRFCSRELLWYIPTTYLPPCSVVWKCCWCAKGFILPSSAHHPIKAVCKACYLV